MIIELVPWSVASDFDLGPVWLLSQHSACPFWQAPMSTRACASPGCYLRIFNLTSMIMLRATCSRYNHHLMASRSGSAVERTLRRLAHFELPKESNARCILGITFIIRFGSHAFTQLQTYIPHYPDSITCQQALYTPGRMRHVLWASHISRLFLRLTHIPSQAGLVSVGHSGGPRWHP